MKILSDCNEVAGPQRQVNCACIVDGGKHLVVADCSGRLRVFSCDYRPKGARGVPGAGAGQVGAALAAVRDKLSAAAGGPGGGQAGDVGDSASTGSGGGQLSRHASDMSIQDLPSDLQTLGEDFGSPQMLMRTLSFSSAVSGSSSRPGSAHEERGADAVGAEDASRIPIGVASKVGGESSWVLVHNPRSKQVFSLESAGGLTVWSLVRGAGD